tara:strand:+ start:1262 stop:1372 length:111 start_codon:yes stop_codon:yes gene_type:complete
MILTKKKYLLVTEPTQKSTASNFLAALNALRFFNNY